MAKPEKNVYLDSDDYTRPFRSSEDNSLELSGVILLPGIPGQNKIHSVPCEYLFGLEMTLEDIRSQATERRFSLCSFKSLLSYHADYSDQSASFCNQNTEPSKYKKENSSKSEKINNSKLNSLEKINDFFFCNIDLIKSMETVYKENIDSSYICGKYENIIKKIYYDEEVRKLENERNELENEKLKIIEKKNHFLTAKKNFEEQTENLKNIMADCSKRISEINKKSENLRIERLELDQAIKKFLEEKAQFDKKREEFECGTDICFTSRSSVTNEKSPRRVEGDLDCFKAIIESIKVSLETKSPPEVAASIIEEIKKEVRAVNSYRKIDKIELKCMKNALEVRAKAFEKYEMIRKSELIMSQRNVDVEFMKIKNLYDKKSKNFQNIELLAAIRQKKKELLQAEEEIKLVMSTIYSLQYEIVNSIENFKEIFNEVLKQNTDLKKNIKLLRIVAMNY